MNTLSAFLVRRDSSAQLVGHLAAGLLALLVFAGSSPNSGENTAHRSDTATPHAVIVADLGSR